MLYAIPSCSRAGVAQRRPAPLFPRHYCLAKIVPTPVLPSDLRDCGSAMLNRFYRQLCRYRRHTTTLFVHLVEGLAAINLNECARKERPQAFSLLSYICRNARRTFHYFSSLSDTASATVTAYKKECTAKATRNRHYISTSRLP